MRNITIKEYAKLRLQKRMQYDVLKHMKPINDFGGMKLNVNAMSWNDVKAVMRELSNFSNWKSVIDIYETCFKISEDVFWEQPIKDYFQSSNYIRETFVKLKEKEIELLRSDDITSALWSEAGGDKLNPFADVVPLVQIGKMFSQYPMDLKEKPYVEILSLLVILKRQREIDLKYDELQARNKSHKK